MASEHAKEPKYQKRLELSSKRLVLTDAGLKALEEYKYKSGSYTVLDNFLNAYWWTPIAEFLPRWIAPNLVTLIGFGTVIFAFFVQMCYATDLGETMEPPRWVHALVGINHFVYQTLDAIDGKQARRTGTTSPLGQLFDHGVDAATTTFLSICTLTVLGVGLNKKAAMAMFAVQMSFWFAQWAEYHTHQMNHSAGGIGVTEAQCSAIAVSLAAAFFGSQVFKNMIPFAPITYADLCFGMSVMSGIFLTFVSLKTVLTTKTVNRTNAMLQTIPIFALVVIGCAWASVPTRHPLLVMATCGTVFTYLTMWMVLCAMTRMDYPCFPSIVFPLPLLFILSYFNQIPDYNDVLLGAYLSYTVYKTYKFIVSTIQEITCHLNINCLTIPYKPLEDKRPAPSTSEKAKNK